MTMSGLVFRVYAQKHLGNFVTATQIFLQTQFSQVYKKTKYIWDWICEQPSQLSMCNWRIWLDQCRKILNFKYISQFKHHIYTPTKCSDVIPYTLHINTLRIKDGLPNSLKIQRGRRSSMPIPPSHSKHDEKHTAKIIERNSKENTHKGGRI